MNKIKVKTVAIEDIWSVPTNKISDFRFGQLIYNSIYKDLLKKQRKNITKIDIIDTLYEISGERLTEIIDNFLKEMEQK